jgi:NDP-mannose synthase
VTRRHAVILAGGKGTRLRPFTITLPKPLVPIAEESSVLEIVMRQLSAQGFTSATLAIGHLGALIEAYVGDGARWGMEVDYSELLEAHRTSEAPITIAAAEREVRIEYGVLDLDHDDTVIGFREEPAVRSMVAIGAYALSRATLQRYEPGWPVGFDKLMRDLLAKGERPATVRFRGFWLDIGRPEDYDRANVEFAELRGRLLPDR